jgi:hypothetical protein
LKGLDIDGEIDQGIERADGAESACFGSLDAQVFGLTVDAFAGGALAVDALVEGTVAIQGDTHQAPSFLVDVFDTAFVFAKLLMGAALARWRWMEQGTAIALRAVAVGMLELVGGMHTQADGAQRRPISVTRIDRMRMLIEGHGGDARARRTGLVGVAGIESGIGSDMQGQGHQHRHGLEGERREIGDIPFVERQGIVSQHHITVDGISGCRHPRAVAPHEFLFLFRGAIGLHLMGALFDAQPTIGIVGRLLLFVEAFGDVGTEIVLFDVGVDVLDILGQDFPQASDLPL